MEMHLDHLLHLLKLICKVKLQWVKSRTHICHPHSTKLLPGIVNVQLLDNEPKAWLTSMLSSTSSFRDHSFAIDLVSSSLALYTLHTARS